MDQGIRSVSFRGDGNVLAVGFKDGQVSLVTFSRGNEDLPELDKTRERSTPILCVRYLFSSVYFITIKQSSIYRFSPDNKLLVASSENCCIDFFNVETNKLIRVAYVTRLQDPVVQIDWGTKSIYIRVIS